MKITFQSQRQESRSKTPWVSACRALTARLNNLGLILKALGAVSMVGLEVHSEKSPRLQKEAQKRG